MQKYGYRTVDKGLITGDHSIDSRKGKDQGVDHFGLSADQLQCLVKVLVNHYLDEGKIQFISFCQVDWGDYLDQEVGVYQNTGNQNIVMEPFVLQNFFDSKVMNLVHYESLQAKLKEIFEGFSQEKSSWPEKIVCPIILRAYSEHWISFIVELEKKNTAEYDPYDERGIDELYTQKLYYVNSKNSQKNFSSKDAFLSDKTANAVLREFVGDIPFDIILQESTKQGQTQGCGDLCVLNTLYSLLFDTRDLPTDFISGDELRHFLIDICHTERTFKEKGDPILAAHERKRSRLNQINIINNDDEELTLTFDQIFSSLLQNHIDKLAQLKTSQTAKRHQACFEELLGMQERINQKNISFDELESLLKDKKVKKILETTGSNLASSFVKNLSNDSAAVFESKGVFAKFACALLPYRCELLLGVILDKVESLRSVDALDCDDDFLIIKNSTDQAIAESISQLKPGLSGKPALEQLQEISSAIKIFLPEDKREKKSSSFSPLIEKIDDLLSSHGLNPGLGMKKH